MLLHGFEIFWINKKMKSDGLKTKKMKTTGLVMRGYFYMWLIIKACAYELNVYSYNDLSNANVMITKQMGI